MLEEDKEYKQMTAACFALLAGHLYFSLTQNHLKLK